MQGKTRKDYLITSLPSLMNILSSFGRKLSLTLLLIVIAAFMIISCNLKIARFL